MSHNVANTQVNLAEVGYPGVVGATAQAGGISTITLAATASSTDSAHKGVYIKITGGTGANQVAYITAYNGTTKVATITPAWTTEPDNTSVYNLYGISGIAQGGAAGTITLASGDSATDDVYVGAYVRISAGTGANQFREIIDYNGTTKVATVKKLWSTNPDNTSTYVIYGESGTATSVSSTTITLATINDAADFYNNLYIEITGSTTAPKAVGQIRKITDFAATTMVATVNSWIVEPADATGLTYKIFGGWGGRYTLANTSQATIATLANAVGQCGVIEIQSSPTTTGINDNANDVTHIYTGMWGDVLGQQLYGQTQFVKPVSDEYIRCSIVCFSEGITGSIHTRFGDVVETSDNPRVGEPVQDHDSAQVVKAVLSAKSGDNYVSVQANSSGAIQTTGGGTQYNVDSAAGSTDTGTLLLAVRDDTLSALTPADGDYTQLRVSSTGALHVTGGGGGTQYTAGTDSFIEGTSAVTGAGAVRKDTATSLVDTDGEFTVLQVDSTGRLWVTPGSGASDLGKAEDAAHSSGDIGVMMLGVRNDTLGNLVSTDGDYASLQLNASGAVYVDGSNSTQPVSGTITANLSATDNAVLDAIQTATEATQAAVETLDNAVSGNELQVDIVASLPAGTNAIGTLAANSGVDIGDVDVTSVVPGTGATNLGKAEDAAHSSGDVGVMPLAVRQDVAGTIAGTDGDYTPLQVDASGSLRVTAGSSTTDDSAFTAGSSAISLNGAVYDDTAPDSVDEGDAGAIRMSANRNVYTQIRDAAGNERGVNVTAGNALTVDGSATTQPISGTVTANLSATDNAVLDAIQAAVETIDNAISGSEMQVDIVASLPAGTNAIGTLAANSGVDIGDVDVTSVVPGTGATNLGKAEDTAHSTGDVGVMALAVRQDTAGAFVTADGDYSPLQVNSSGSLRVLADLGTTDNAVLDNIETNTDSLTVTGGGTEASALRVTIANDSTGVINVSNDGTFTVQVDGLALSALQKIDDSVYVDDADWTATSSSHTLIGGVYQSSPGTITDGDTGPLRLSANGAAHVLNQRYTSGSFWTSASPGINGKSASVDIEHVRYLTIVGQESTNSPTLTVEISNDNSTWYATFNTISAFGGTDFVSDVSLNSRYVRLSTDVACTSITAIVMGK